MFTENSMRSSHRCSYIGHVLDDDRTRILLVTTALYCISLICALTPSTESTFVVCLQKTVCALHIAARITHVLDDDRTTRISIG